MEISRAHSFPRKILPNSAGQFAKFYRLPWQNRPNPFCLWVNWDHQFVNFCYWRLSLCSVMLATYKENYQLFKYSQVFNRHVLDWSIHTAQSCCQWDWPWRIVCYCRIFLSCFISWDVQVSRNPLEDHVVFDLQKLSSDFACLLGIVLNSF